MPVITLPVSFGRVTGREELGVHSLLDDLVTEHFIYTTHEVEDVEVLGRMATKNSDNSLRRPKRQVRNYSKYEELAERTGGLAVRTTRDRVEEVARMMEVEQYPSAVLWRGVGLSSSQRVKVPIDSLVREIEVSISGGVTSATLSSPSGAIFDLLTQTNGGDPKGYTLVVSTPYLLLARIDLTQRQEDLGEWTLSFVPREVCSVTVSARTKMDILPAFYLPDDRAFQPSLQRVHDQPSQDLDSYLDMVITGVDRAGLRQVDGIHLLDRSGSEAAIKLPTSSPRRNTYLSLPTRDLPQERFTVALVGKDSSGQRFRRESVASWERVESMMSFPLGRDVWGPPGSILKVPITITNTDTSTGTTNTLFLTAHDAFGFPVTLDQPQVTLGQNESATVVATVFVDPQSPPRTTNSLVVSASSPRGDTSHTRAHISITPRDVNGNAPTCEVQTKSSCSSDSLSSTTCAEERWSVRFVVRDDTGVFDVKSQPSYNFPNFVSGSTEVVLEYGASCCYPEVTITARDVDNNLGICRINNGDLVSSIEDDPQLTTAAITGIAVGSVLLVLVIVAVVAIFVIRQRRSKKEDVTVRRPPRRLSTE